MIHQDAKLFLGRLAQNVSYVYTLQEGRGVWLQLIKGSLDVNGNPLTAGDGAAVENESRLDIMAHNDAEFLLFDLG